ncbi:hypothetical protein TNCT_56001 [Trichonephila clavata]|uniref:Uncharacterized protein n=1 Tax=Trichonephila clavata TaxID=2740835 RepID=A0A8X6LEX7_TRICU|nr:hypothetical protein TNCT_56001 [Trichonephila clavata]
MFSVECLFSDTSDSGLQLLWTERGARCAQKFVRECDQYGPDLMYLSIVRPCNEVFKSKDIEEVRQSLCQASYEELEKVF